MIKSQEDISKKTSEPVRYRITATLLNSWQYIYDAEDIYYTDDEEKGISAEDKLAAEKEKRYHLIEQKLSRILGIKMSKRIIFILRIPERAINKIIIKYKQR